MTDYTADWTALPTRESADSRLHQGSARRPFPSLIVRVRPSCDPVVLIRSIRYLCFSQQRVPARACDYTESHHMTRVVTFIITPLRKPKRNSKLSDGRLGESPNGRSVALAFGRSQATRPLLSD